MSRSISLIGHVLGGYVLGSLAGGVMMMLFALTGVDSEPVHAAVTTLAGVAGASTLLLAWIGGGEPQASDSHGSARFSLEAEDQETLGGGGLIVGRALTRATGASRPASTSRLLRYDGPAHLLTIAPTRSGKGIGAVIPNLLTAERSVFCIDPKGENARIAAAARRRLGPVFVLDPFEAAASPSAAFNPLCGLDSENEDVAEAAFAIADALVVDPPGSSADAHWNEEAKALISGLVLHVAASAGPADRTLSEVRRLLTLPPDRFLALLEDMQASGAAAGLVARAANRHLSKSDREGAGVLSSAQRHTHFLDSPRMARTLARSDFRFEDLRSRLCTVFLVLPPERLAAHARWLRLLVVQAVFALSSAGPRPEGEPRPPVLFLLDEFAALGRLEPVLNAFGLMAGYGVQLWAILQDIHQLRGTYGRNAGTFLSNAGLIQIFNVADTETAGWVSRALGGATEVFQTTGASASRSPGRWASTQSASRQENVTRRDLLTPDEVMRFASDRMILLRPGLAPTLARKVRYFEDPEFKDLYQRL